MSQEYNPDKKPNLLKRIDDYLIDKSIKIATKWENKVKRSKDDLATLCYGTSMIGFGAKAMMQRSIFPAIMAGIFGIKVFFYKSRPNTTWDNHQIDIWILGMGIISTTLGLTNFAIGIAKGDNEYYQRSLEGIIVGISAISYVSGQYFSRIKLENPSQNLYENHK